MAQFITAKKKNPWLVYETEVPHSRFCDSAAVSPAEKLSLKHLQLLRNAYTCLKSASVKESRQSGRTKRNRVEEDEERGMKFEEFREVIRSVIGPGVEDTWAEHFFSEVDICCTGQVTWQQLCAYLLLEYNERERASIPMAALLDSPQTVRHCSNNKREPTVRAVAISYPPPLRYISVSKGGQVTVWNRSLHILKTVGLAGDPTDEIANTRRFRGWTTDAVYMGNVNKVVISTNCRDLHFINVSTNSIFEDVHLFGFPCVLTALCYWCDIQYIKQPSLLLLGDDRGGVHLMQFLNPSEGLFKNPTKKESMPQRILFQDLSKHNSMVSYRYIPAINQGPINRVMFELDTNVVMTSSESSSTSMVFFNVSVKREPYIWKIKEGAKCFDYNPSMQLIVTGGCDRAVRLWARFVTTCPVATLRGHRTAVLDVAIYQPVEQIFSYSRDAELRIWDISTHLCLKSISLPFPCLKPGYIPEHGNFPFLLLSPPLPEQTQPHLLVGCKDYLALLSLAERGRGGRGGWLTDEGSEPEPKTALSCALYNPTLRQVVTGHVNSTVSMWDVQTGRRRLQISNTHGEEELTCMTLDTSHRRLITGARNGTIKVWNMLNGLNLHKLEPVNDADVTGVVCLHGNQLISVGWSQRIAQYDIASSKDLYVKSNMSWKCSRVHKSDILAVHHCTALDLVATASHDGEVIIWRLETKGPLLHLQRQTPSGVASPVDSLIFLQHRANNRYLRNRGVLVSSQAGCLCFWSVTGQTHTYGQFYAPKQPDELVLTLSSDHSKNTVLISGDTSGWLQIWDISHYALEIQNKAGCEQPPLLQSWKAHTRAVVSLEVLEIAEKLFVLTASTDGNAGLWTKDGDHVGSFGQEAMWNITDSYSYQIKRKTQKNETEPGFDKNKSQASDPANRGQTSERHSSSEAFSPRAKDKDHEQPQQPKRKELSKRRAWWRENLYDQTDHR